MLINIDIDKIHPDPEQPRKTFDEQKVKEMAESYDTHGIIQPIKVRRHKSLPDDEYMIIVGEYRWRAAKLKGKTQVEVTVEKGVTDQQAREMQYIENLQRSDYLVEELGKSFEEYCRTNKCSGANLSRKIGRSERFVHRAIRIQQKLSPTLHNSKHHVWDYVKDKRQLSIEEKDAITSIPDHKRQEEVAKPFIGKEIHPDKVRAVTSKARTEPNKPVKEIVTEELTKELVSRLPESMKPLTKPLEPSTIKLTGDALNLMLDYQHLENCIKGIPLESIKLMPERARAALYMKGEEVIEVITIFNAKLATNSTILIKGGKNNGQTTR